MSTRVRHLGELRVVEVSISQAGALVGKLTADLGAAVERLVISQPSSLSRAGSWLDAGKSERVVTLASVASEAHRTDVLIWDDIYGRLGPMPERLRYSASFTLELVGSFVNHGPWSEATLLAESGLAHLTGRTDGPPIPLPGHQVAMLTGCQGFAALGAAIANGLAGTPQAHLQLAAVEVLAGLHQFSLIDYVCNGRIRRRSGRRWTNNHPIGTFPCNDGHVAVCSATDEQFVMLCIALDVPEFAEDPRFQTATSRHEHADELDAIIAPRIAAMGRNDVFKRGNETGVPIAPVLDPDEILAEPNLHNRRFWALQNGVKIPRLGVHPITSPSLATRSDSRPGRPMAGLKVVEFTKVWAGPLAGRTLADLGAEVIRIEAPFSRGPADVPPGAAVKPAIFPRDEPGNRPWNRQGIANILHRSKKSVCLDIKDQRARQIAYDLCCQADVILDNNRPDALSRSGLGFEDVASNNPRVIFVGMSGYGARGSAYRDYPAYGPVTEAMGGLVWWIRDGREPDIPLPTGVGFPDPIIAALAAARVSAALNERLATGQGSFVDLSQVECTAIFLGDLLMKWQRSPVGGRSWRMGREPGSLALRAAEGGYIVVTDPNGRYDSAALERLVGTRAPDPDRLRDAGLAAAWDNDAPRVLRSPELSDFWVDFDHPDVGRYTYDGNPFVAGGERLPSHIFASLGEHNRAVLKAWLGYDDTECDRLEANGVLVSTPRPPIE